MIYFLLMDRKNKVSYQEEEEELSMYSMQRLEGKRAKLRNFRKFNLLGKRSLLFFAKCVLLYVSYKILVYVISTFIKTVNRLEPSSSQP